MSDAIGSSFECNKTVSDSQSRAKKQQVNMSPAAKKWLNERNFYSSDNTVEECDSKGNIVKTEEKCVRKKMLHLISAIKDRESETKEVASADIMDVEPRSSLLLEQPERRSQILMPVEVLRPPDDSALATKYSRNFDYFENYHFLDLDETTMGSGDFELASHVGTPQYQKTPARIKKTLDEVLTKKEMKFKYINHRVSFDTHEHSDGFEATAEISDLEPIISAKKRKDKRLKSLKHRWKKCTERERKVTSEERKKAVKSQLDMTRELTKVEAESRNKERMIRTTTPRSSNQVRSKSQSTIAATSSSPKKSKIIPIIAVIVLTSLLLFLAPFIFSKPKPKPESHGWFLNDF